MESCFHTEQRRSEGQVVPAGPVWWLSSQGPLLASRILVEPCPWLLSRVLSLCRAAACDKSAMAQLPRKAGQSCSPSQTSELRGERQGKSQVPKQQVIAEIILRFMEYSCSFIPPALPSPVLLLPCQEHTFVQRSEKIKTMSILWEEKISFVVIPLFSSAQGPRMGHSNALCVTGTKAGDCGDG